jgi:hypothetical protein
MIYPAEIFALHIRIPSKIKRFLFHIQCHACKHINTRMNINT